MGIVTDRDLAVELLAEDGPANLFKSDVELEALTAGDVMTADPLVVDSDDELPRVLHHMTEAHARRIPVVDDNGSLTGILTLDDVVTHLAGESAHVSAQLDNVAGVIRSESPQE
ncbi:CBS domain-containing protein [Halosimplex aquaticum]